MAPRMKKNLTKQVQGHSHVNVVSDLKGGIKKNRASGRVPANQHYYETVLETLQERARSRGPNLWEI